MARSSLMTGLVSGVVAGALAGSMAGWMARGPSETAALDPSSLGRLGAPDGGSEDGAEVDLELVTEPSSRDVASVDSRGAAGREPAAAGDGLGEMFSKRLLDHAAKGIRTAWGEARQDEPTEAEVEEGVGLFKEQTLATPTYIGYELASRRSEAELALEDARTGGVFAVLGRLDDGADGPLFDVVDSAEVFDQFFQREKGGPSLDGGNGISQADPVPDGATLFFPSGVHEISDFGSKWREHFPRDLTIRGAGKDNTMIVLRSDISAYDTVRNLTFENCTIHAGDNYLFDVRQPSMSVTIQSCRIVAWLSGAGSSCLFGTKALALRVIDTEISGVYNKTQRWGQLFDVRTNGLLARFENCSFEALAMFHGTRSGSTLVFVNCQTKDLIDNRKVVPNHARLLGTQVNWYEGKTPDELGRDLNDLFPNWKEQMQRNR